MTDIHDKTEKEYQVYVNSLLLKGTAPENIPTIQDYISQREKQDETAYTEKHEKEAKIIQRAWRRHIDMQVFKYYKDLINFHQRGDPAVMLKSINPKEADLLDPAAGTHIKFRLAGDKFPPNIYYKIFTHRPIQDLCANSPKDYTKCKELDARQLHNKTFQPINQMAPRWYQRSENNGWRLVSDRVIAHIFTDPFTWDSNKKLVSFHHDKLQRRQDVEKRRKQRKLEWMKKLYNQGMVRARVDDEETAELVDNATKGMIGVVDEYGPDIVKDWEVDELLDWTTSLNYDEYLFTWKELATTNGSEYRIEARKQMYFELQEDAIENVSQSNARSHNTPASNTEASK